MSVARFRTPVLLLTDIGADIDDTEALLALLGSENLRLVACVTASNDGLARGALLRGWLRRLSVPDEDVPIFPSVDLTGAACIAPKDFPIPPESALCSVDETPFRILDVVKQHGSELVIICISPVTPLASAMKLDSDKSFFKKVKRIYVQGNVIIDPTSNSLTPDSHAYNFRMDMTSASELLELQNDVPFSFLGKFAAYKVGITKDDLESLSRPHLPSVSMLARDQMNEFRLRSPDLWYKLYPVDAQYRNSSMDWFDHLPGDIVSHPYDPLTVLMANEDSVECFPHNGASIFERIDIGNIVRSTFRPQCVGNEKSGCSGVPNPDLVRNTLIQSMVRGISCALIADQL